VDFGQLALGQAARYQRIDEVHEIGDATAKF
jgi:hypothetical protein